MFKLFMYSMLCFVFSTYAMHLDTLYPEILQKICQYIDPVGYAKLVYPIVPGDILFVSSEQKRTQNTEYNYDPILLKNTHFGVLASVNTILNQKLTAFVNNYHKINISKAFLYKEHINFFLKHDEIEFFNKTIHKDNDSYTIIAKLENTSFSKFIIYNFTLNITSQTKNLSIADQTPFLDWDSPLTSISLILSACIQNNLKQQAEGKNLIEEITSYCKHLISICSKKLNDPQGIFLKLERTNDVDNNWNLFSADLFCKLIAFKNIIISNEDFI